MMNLYREFILDHYKNPRNYGEMETPDIQYQEGNPLCGDEIQIALKLKDGVVEDVKFKGHGCAISMASTSILTEMIKGKSLDEVKKIGKDEMLQALYIPIGPTRLKCALLGLKVLKAGVYGIHEWPGEEEDK